MMCFKHNATVQELCKLARVPKRSTNLGMPCACTLVCLQGPVSSIWPDLHSTDAPAHLASQAHTAPEHSSECCIWCFLALPIPASRAMRLWATHALLCQNPAQIGGVSLLCTRPGATSQVAIVTIGLVLRGLGAVSLSALLQQGTGGWAAASSSSTLVGVLLIVLSSLCYSLLGVGYEWLMQAVPGRAPSQAQVR